MKLSDDISEDDRNALKLSPSSRPGIAWIQRLQLAVDMLSELARKVA